MKTARRRLLLVILSATSAIAVWARPVIASGSQQQVSIYLSDQQPIDETYGPIDNWSTGANMVSGKTYVHSVAYDVAWNYQGTDSITYNLGGNCSTLGMTVGVDDSSSQPGQGTLDIILDGQVAKSVTVSLGHPQAVSLPVSGTIQLKIDATWTGQDPNNSSDQAKLVMGDASLSCAATNVVQRLAGSDRIGTAIAASQDAYPATGSAQAVVMSRYDSYADALAGTPLALGKDAPLLLTPSGSLDSRTQGELQRVLSRGKTVYLLGGTAALSPAVASSVAGLGYQVVRLAGIDRYDTAIQVASQGLGNPSTVLIADGTDYHDALAAGPASMKLGGAAVILTAGDQMASETSSYLAQHPADKQYAVGQAAAAAAPGAVAIVGSSYAATAVAVANRFFPSPVNVGVASSDNFPDALGGGVHIAKAGGGPLLYSSGSSLSSDTDNYLKSNAAAINVAVLYGGTAALSSGVGSAVQQDIT